MAMSSRCDEEKDFDFNLFEKCPADESLDMIHESNYLDYKKVVKKDR
jgi:hypothetical protein